MNTRINTDGEADSSGEGEGSVEDVAVLWSDEFTTDLFFTLGLEDLYWVFTVNEV